jgi:acyl carrier protein
MSASTAIYGKVTKVLMESLNVDEEEVRPAATLQGDLGAESIDFLDIVFRLEREFGIQGTAKGAPACAQCHAFNGESDGSGAFPRLAGQSASYLAEQLRDFASGVRRSALMSQIAHSVSPEERADVAAYYANIDAPYVPTRPADPKLLERGQELAVRGSEREQIPACNACHGPAGVGEPPAIPYLAGQYARYIALNLTMWQRGYRKNSAGGMAAVAEKLTPADIAAVAAYYERQAPSAQTPTSQVSR